MSYHQWHPLPVYVRWARIYYAIINPKIHDEQIDFLTKQLTEKNRHFSMRASGGVKLERALSIPDDLDWNR